MFEVDVKNVTEEEEEEEGRTRLGFFSSLIIDQVIDV